MKPVLVSLHAHPDDEAIFTGGVITAAVEARWRVVLVLATDGDLGASPSSGGDVGAHRRNEALAAATALGIERVEFLGFGDSGFCSPVGDPAGSAVARARGLRSGTLADAFVEGAARRVRRILVEEGAAALTSYDANGIYGHIDHVQVHEIAARGVEGNDCALVEATMSRTRMRTLRSDLLGRGLESDRLPLALVEQLGVEDGPDLLAADVTPYLGTKLAALAAHPSQVVEASTFMGLPAGAFHHLLGTEWFRMARPGDGRFVGLVRSIGRGPDLPAPAADVVADRLVVTG